MTTRTLGELVYRTLLKTGQGWEGVATSGSTTTIIDTVFLKQADDHWGGTGENTGAAYIVATTDGLAPQGEYGRVTDFDNATNKATIDTLSAAVGAGDIYMLSMPLFPLHMVLEHINRAMQETGPRTLVDTSISTAAGQSEYTLPDTNIKLKKVDIETVTGDANRNEWRSLGSWTIEKTAGGSADTLIFPYVLSSGRTLRLTYTQFPVRLSVYGDKLDEGYPFEIIVARAALFLMRAVFMELQNTDPNMKNKIALLQDDLDRLEEMSPHRTPTRTRNDMIISGYG